MVNYRKRRGKRNADEIEHFFALQEHNRPNIHNKRAHLKWKLDSKILFYWNMAQKKKEKKMK